MLEVLPVREKEKQEEYCSRIGIEYDPDTMCYAAWEGGELLGISLFHIEGTIGVIDRVVLKAGLRDDLAQYLLAKAPLNFVDLCGIRTAQFRDADKALAQKLEFLEREGVWQVDLTGYFTTPCHRHNEQEA